MTAWGIPQLVELLLKRGANPLSVDIDSLRRERCAMPEDFESGLKIVSSHLEEIAI